MGREVRGSGEGRGNLGVQVRGTESVGGRSARGGVGGGAVNHHHVRGAEDTSCLPFTPPVLRLTMFISAASPPPMFISPSQPAPCMCLFTCPLHLAACSSTPRRRRPMPLPLTLP
jgi:hypothetical protein